MQIIADTPAMGNFKLVAPKNDLYVKIDKPMQDFVQGIHIDTRYNPEEHVEILATVHSLPRGIQDTPDYRGYTLRDINEGDIVLMQYDVVHNYREQRNGFRGIPLNIVDIDGETFWKANILSILAVVRGTDFHMLNGWVMITKPKTDSRIYVAGKTEGHKTSRAWVQYIGNELEGSPKLDVVRGDEVFFNGKFAIDYSINGKDFSIIKQRQILGVRR